MHKIKHKDVERGLEEKSVRFNITEHTKLGIGWIDHLAVSKNGVVQISGWIISKDSASHYAPDVIYFALGDRVLAECVPNKIRTDVTEVYLDLDSPKCGFDFEFKLPKAIRNLSIDDLQVVGRGRSEKLFSFDMPNISEFYQCENFTPNVSSENSWKGYVDDITNYGNSTRVSGWALCQLKGIEAKYTLPNKIYFAHNNNIFGWCKPTILRTDVTRSLQCEDEKNALCGFYTSIPCHYLPLSPINELTVLVETTDGGLAVVNGPHGFIPQEHPSMFKKTEFDRYLISDFACEIDLGLTTLCNNKCVYCYINDKTYKHTEINSEVLDRIIDSAERMNAEIIVLGAMGEPTLSDFFWKLQENNKLKFAVLTNLAKRFTPFEISKLACLKQITISLDSANAKNLKLLRPPTNIETVLYNIIAIKAYAFEHNIPGPTFRLNVVINELVAQDFAQLSSFCVILGVSSVNLLEMRPTFVGTDLLPAKTIEMAPDKEKVRASLLEGILILRSKGVGVSAGANVEKFLGVTLNKSPNIAISGDETRFCLDPWKIACIYPDGTWTPCCFMLEGKLTTSYSLDDALKSSRMRRLRRELLSGDLNPTCRDCILMRPCSLSELRVAVDSLYRQKSINV